VKLTERYQRWRREPRRLRRRLVAVVVALVALASMMIGFASSALVVQSLLASVDEDLAHTSQRVASSLSDRFPNRLDRPGFQVGTAIVALNEGEFQGAYIDENGSLQEISGQIPERYDPLTWVGQEPQTLSLWGFDAPYRFSLVSQTPEVTIIAGLPLAPVQKTIRELNRAIFVIVLIAMALAIVLGTWAVRRSLRSLERIRDTAVAISQQPLSQSDETLQLRVPEDFEKAQSEVGQVGQALNTMLDHIDASLQARADAEARVRQFVADASHELRTPLASIRGYSELTLRHGSALPSEVTQSLSRIESESDRMAKLVNDLLLLARLDEGQTAPREAVDLAAVCRSAISDAYVMESGHLWAGEGLDAPVVITGDESGLYQVVSNLLANARVHTPPGTSVTVALTNKKDSVVLRVTDNGPGIPANVRKTLFERFSRGDASRTRATGSTGLGLAIVASLVSAHNGTIAVTSRQGKTTFSVTLPKGA
jgi:two-component system OmpR family sensor kinase